VPIDDAATQTDPTGQDEVRAEPDGAQTAESIAVVESDPLSDADLALLALEHLNQLREAEMTVAERGHRVKLLDGGDLVSASRSKTTVGTGVAESGEYEVRSREVEMWSGMPQIAGARLMAALDQMGLEMTSTPDARLSQQETFISTVEGVTIAASAGLVAGILRSGSLAAVAASSLPVWKGVDPLAVLDISEEERRKREREMLEAEEDEASGELAVGRILDRA
jgi:hypothetical protein